MDKGNFIEEFKLDAIKQIAERGHSLLTFRRGWCEYASAYACMKRYAVPPVVAAKEYWVAKAGTVSRH